MFFDEIDGISNLRSQQQAWDDDGVCGSEVGELQELSAVSCGENVPLGSPWLVAAARR